MTRPIIVWFRDDLRLTDNAALHWAAERGPVVGLTVDETVGRPLGAAARWWRRHSEASISEKLPLIRAKGDPRAVVPRIAQALGAEVTWNRRYHLTDVDAAVKERIGATSHPGFLLNEPWEVVTGSGTPFKVFTPFYKAVQALLIDAPPHPLEAPQFESADVDVAALSDADEVEEPAWSQTLAAHNTPGEDAALARFHEFLERLRDGGSYDNNDLAGGMTSGLSPHLRFGELSPGYVWAETAALADEYPAAAPHAWAFLRQVVWREFAWHRYYHVPKMETHNVRGQFDHFDWAWTERAVPSSDKHAFAHQAMDPEAEHLGELAQWQRGETGVPLVDAGMRELWATGAMHNRVRMVAGSWLTKNLGIHWRHGEEWFWDTLVDADVASNPFNWQWVAGSGDDAAPYFRVFNPELQREKFDPDGTYVSKWVPEALTPMYPEPMVDIKESRKRALAAYDDMKAATES
ncbi:Deoxyribodipyrimidine photo-lyase [Corynebacterium glaucum]|uniref:cryptochrome/photolyase family protein n=1 Tax=Corynebacterium glaucum TaxID=187491 RepID=UPI0025B2EEF3|nr:deoxyribodipyrimidine photo-lyase [Corynebacterium glaucum]WJZ07337.1 Deoxyribodipyrimidine photo-lyase [Corynebacterium glaucum]